uniref:DUF6598 domain-containing protein n=1 Tax=Leersia perrieri TaxID=77586 RepID=A0A0D9XT84_9ORYZ
MDADQELQEVIKGRIGDDGDLNDARRQPDDDEEDNAPNPYDYRLFFEFYWHFYNCKIDDVTRGPTSRTPASRIYPCVEVYLCRVIDLTAGLAWPIDVFGFIAARDSHDRKRNYIFNRERDNAQTLTAEDSTLVLTGPIRAISCGHIIDFEIELKLRGKTKSDKDKVLSARYIVYESFGAGANVGLVRSEARPGKRCSVEITFAHLAKAVEAAIEVRIVQGSSDFYGRFVARTDGYDEDVVLLDCTGSVPVTNGDGVIRLARSVVVVESTGVLNLHVSTRTGHVENVFAECHAEFAAQCLESSRKILDLGFCKMLATISWSMIPMI